MSNDPREQTVRSILPFLKDYFIGLGRKYVDDEITEVEFHETSTSERRGATGSVLISNIAFSAKQQLLTHTIALKFFEDKKSALNELKNAMELIIKFKTAPEFGIPEVIFASTQDPIMIIYEGIYGTNYDELQLPGKAYEAGRLLATIHGSETRSVDTETYQNLIRMMGQYLTVTGQENQIANSLRYHYDKLEGALSGTNPFSDFHQSNVMMSHFDEEIVKVYVIDPEFMQKGSFDRLEDVGTFFGFQLFQEYSDTGGIVQGLKDIDQFLVGYDSKNKEQGGYFLNHMYTRGCPLPFFIAQWALMDALDLAFNRGGSLESPEVALRIEFALFVLQGDQIRFPNA